MLTFQQLNKNFLKDPAKAALLHRLGDRDDEAYQMEEKRTTYYHVLNYLLPTYDTDDLIAGVEAEITNFKQPDTVFVVRYSEALCEKPLRCSRF